MNRETIIAIILGFTGGILVAFLLITVPGKFNFNKKIVPQVTPQKQPPKEEEMLKIESPENETFVEGKTIAITGTVVSQASVIINSPAEDQVIQTDKEGKFTTTIGIIEGENSLNVSAYLNEGQVVTKNLTIFASEETL